MYTIFILYNNLHSTLKKAIGVGIAIAIVAIVGAVAVAILPANDNTPPQIEEEQPAPQAGGKDIVVELRDGVGTSGP